VPNSLVSFALVAACVFSIVACSAHKNTVEVLESYKRAPSIQEASEDQSISAKRYLAAAERGDSKAMLELGVLYANGVGGSRNYAEALRWYRLAAAKGERRAMHNIGYMHENGLGVPASHDEAIRWYVMAAEAGDAFAMDILGNMQSAGRGFARSYPEAAKWYRKAAERGFTKSMVRLARMYHQGVGVAQSDEYAYAWAALAWSDHAAKSKGMNIFLSPFTWLKSWMRRGSNGQSY
jgi:TPR repeat protein